MTALRLEPGGFLPLHTKELRLASDRALERAVIVSCAAMIVLFALSLASKGWWPRAIVPPVFAIPEHDLSRIDPHAAIPAPRVPQRTIAPRRDDAAVIVPARDEDVPPLLHDLDRGRSAAGEGRDTSSVPPAGTGERLSDEDIPDPTIPPIVDEYPNIASAPAPAYPELARSAGVEGTVVVLALVDLDGHVRDTLLRRSVPLLDDAALSAVRQWRFTPALVNRHPVRVWVAVPVRFRLH